MDEGTAKKIQSNMLDWKVKMLRVIGINQFNGTIACLLLFLMFSTMFVISRIDPLMVNQEKKTTYTPKILQNFNLKEHFSNVSNTKHPIITHPIITHPNTLDNQFVDIEEFNLPINPNQEMRKTSMTIIVITMDRPHSLKRLLKSLKRAQYGSKEINLEIHQDTLPDSTLHPQTTQVIQTFTWTQGSYNPRFHKTHQGIINMWLNAWIPTEEEELGLILEDDQEVSPFFAKWLIKAHHHFILNPKTADREICSISLSRPLYTASNHGHTPKNLEEFIKTTSPAIKYRMPSSWGLAPRASQWLEFRRWFRRSYSSSEPFVEGLDLYEYYKTLQSFHRQDSLWLIWFVAYSDVSQCYTLYPYINNPFKLALVKNHQEKGLHTPIKKQQDNEVLHIWSDAYMAFPRRVPKYDYTDITPVTLQVSDSCLFYWTPDCYKTIT